MITKLIGLVGGAGLTELQLKIAVAAVKAVTVAVICAGFFVGGCSYKASQYNKDAIKDVIKAQDKAAKEFTRRTKAVIGDEKEGQIYNETLQASKQKVQDAISTSDIECATSPDELRELNELAKAAGG